MSDTLYSLLWYPATRAIEATRFSERRLPGRDALVLHRRLAPNLAMGLSYAEIGVELLPPHARPTAGDGVRLLWLPIIPSRCLLTARDASGVVRITDRPEHERDPSFSSVLEHLEAECAWAFDEAFSAPEPAEAEIALRLAAACELAIDAVGRFVAHGPPPQLWSVGGVS